MMKWAKQSNIKPIIIILGLSGILIGSFLINTSYTKLDFGFWDFDFSPDGSKICVVSNFKDLYIFDAEVGGLLYQDRFESIMYECMWGPTGEYLLVSRFGDEIYPYTIPYRGILIYSDFNSEPIFVDIKVVGIDWDTTGEYIVISDKNNWDGIEWKNNSVSIYDKFGNKINQHFPFDEIHDISWGGGNEIACLLEDRIIILDAFSGEIFVNSSYRSDNSYDIQWDPTNKYLLVSNYWGIYDRLFDFMIVDSETKIQYEVKTELGMHNVKWNNDGQFLSFSGETNNQDVWGVIELNEIINSTNQINYHLYPQNLFTLVIKMRKLEFKW